MASGTDKTLATERRRECRVPVQLPMLVRGGDRNGAWFEERTFAQNLSREGAAFTTLIPLQMGAMILIGIPAARPLRTSHGFFDKSPDCVLQVGQGRAGNYDGGEVHRITISTTLCFRMGLSSPAGFICANKIWRGR